MFSRTWNHCPHIQPRQHAASGLSAAQSPPGAPSDVPPLPPEREPDIIILPPKTPPPDEPPEKLPPAVPPPPKPDRPEAPTRLDR